MLQNQLSQSLGLPVRLGGDYSLKIFPRLKIAGSGLEIGQTAGPEAMAFSRHYSAVVELAPFIHHEVRISSIQLSGGYLDLSRLPTDAAAENGRPGPGMTLPQVASLEIDDFSIHTGKAEKVLQIDQLLVKDFKAGRESAVSLQARLINATAEIAWLKIDGSLTVGEGAFSPRFVIHEMTVKRGGSVIVGLDGSWEWDQPGGHLTGQMRWQAVRAFAEMHLDMATKPSPSGALLVDYRDPEQPESASLSIGFLVRPDLIELNDLNLRVAGQSIVGSGCFVQADTARLNLELHAETLDLDRIQSIYEMPEGEGAEMPVELAIELRVSNARLGGAEATDAVVAVGDPPACPATGSNE